MADSPCGWSPTYMESTGTACLDVLPVEDREAVEQMAVDYLWRWTGRVFGVCETTVRPCREGCSGNTFQGTILGAGYPAGSIGYECGTCLGACTCKGSSAAIRLPGPVQSVTEVLLDGAVVDPAVYRIDNGRILVRNDGGTWPFCQNLDAEPTAEGTWQVTYMRGVPVPDGGKVAAGILALEMCKAVNNDTTCQLPKRVQTITRQGVTVALVDAFEGIEEGQTGIWQVDSWVSSITRPKRPGSVRSVDIPHPRTRTTTWRPT